MIYDLVKPSHPLLSANLERFSFDSPPINPVELANSLIETMMHYKGIGLSANQCGLPYRVFALRSVEPLVLFNPVIADVSSEEIKLDEGCLTYPNLFLPIKRPTMVKVRYQDAFGNFHTEKYIGMTARCILHELDHLNGIDYTKRANPIHLSRAFNQKKILDRKVKKLKQLG